MISVKFNIPGEKEMKERLARGYRARRNFLIAQLFSSIVYMTPVKTGKARGGWQISIGSRPASDVDRLDPEGGDTIIAELSNLKGASPFANVFISNLTDYIEQLEGGSSTQAPFGIVTVALPAFRAQYGDVT